MLYNRCFRFLQRASLQDRVLKELAAQQPAHATADPIEAAQFAETSRLVQQAIAQLPSQARRIYQLSRTGGLRIADIAAQLGITPQSVKNSLQRSAASIRRYLEDYDIYLPLILLLWTA